MIVQRLSQRRLVNAHDCERTDRTSSQAIGGSPTMGKVERKQDIEPLLMAIPLMRPNSSPAQACLRHRQVDLRDEEESCDDPH